MTWWCKPWGFSTENTSANDIGRPALERRPVTKKVEPPQVVSVVPCERLHELTETAEWRALLNSWALTERRSAAGDMNPKLAHRTGAGKNWAHKWTRECRKEYKYQHKPLGAWQPISGWDPSRRSKAGNNIVKTEIRVSKVSHGQKSQAMPPAPSGLLS